MPGLLGLFVLVGLAVSSESRDEARSGGSDDTSESAPGRSVADSKPVEPRNGTQVASDLDDFSAEVSADDGRVALDLGGAAPAARTIANDGRLGPSVTLDPLTDDDHVGLRLLADGSLEPVTSAEVRPGDLVVAPVGSGIDVVGADGTRIEIRPSRDESGGLSTNAVAADGSTEPISPDEEGRIDAGDGVVIQLPPAGDFPWRRLLAGLVFVVAAGLVIRHLARREAPAEPFGVDFVGPTGIPADRFDEFLAMLSEDPDPARAIRLAFLAAEGGLEGLSPRRSTETPFEWATRVATKRPDVVEPLGMLASRFAATRFGGYTPTPTDRDFVVEQLRRLQIAARRKLAAAQ